MHQIAQQLTTNSVLKIQRSKSPHYAEKCDKQRGKYPTDE